jgi:hypothetical protein
MFRDDAQRLRLEQQREQCGTTGCVSRHTGEHCRFKPTCHDYNYPERTANSYRARLHTPDGAPDRHPAA